MKFVGQTLFELSRYKRSVDRRTDRRTDGQTDGRTDKVITIGLPHLRWRGPNYSSFNVLMTREKDGCVLAQMTTQAVDTRELVSLKSDIDL